MARCLRSLFRLSLSFQNKIVMQNALLSGRRFLYTDQNLGINGYLRTKKFFQHQFFNAESSFRDKMKDICQDENSMIFTEDLKAMLHLLEKKSEDLELITKMLKKFSKQNKEIRFSTYIFGPIIMRAFYMLNEPDLALSVMNDPEMGSLFDHLASYQVLMCLLYKNEKYAEIREIYDKVQEKAIYGKVHPRQLQQLLMAACYKENTPEAFEYATKVYRDSLDKGVDMLRRSIIFLAALAINQNAPHVALEVLTTISKTSHFMDSRCLKILACMNLNRFFEIVPILKDSLERDRPHMKKELFFADVIEALEEHAKSNELPESESLLKLIYQLRLNNHVTEKTLGEYLDQPIETFRRRTDDTQNEDTFTKRTRYTQQRSNLRDLL